MRDNGYPIYGMLSGVQCRIIAGKKREHLQNRLLPACMGQIPKNLYFKAFKYF